MCGILLSIFRGERTCTTQIKKIITKRGPDLYNEIHTNLGNGWNCELFGSTLWMQGEKPCRQPSTHSNGSFLLWNGDVFCGLEKSDTSSDTDVVLAEFVEKNIFSTLTKICGPYAFIYYDSIDNTLWIGRDVLGRHSLLWNITRDQLLVTSVCCRTINIEEVPCFGIFKVDLSQSTLNIQLHPWVHLLSDYELQFPHTITSKITNPFFKSPEEYYWYNKEPTKEEIQFLDRFSKNTVPSTFLQFLTDYPPISSLKDNLKNLLIQSLKRRIEIKPNYCKNCVNSLTECNHSKIGILFSGGLDSTILALLSSYIIPIEETVDLYNVAFDRFGTKINNCNYTVPDRKNGRESLKNLQRLVPQRKWNFIEINVDEEELKHYRNNLIADLIHPLSSILDDSLGCALWFAARGKGFLNREEYISPARVVLVGMGADEIFGGYSRHKRIFNKNGWASLGLQLIEEVKNIGKRNLGRDNRVITDHGRQPRTPFLDENFLKFSTSLPPWQRCCLSSNLPAGTGDKMLLRCLAWDLGLTYCSSLPKKALQFGSKIANPKEKGHELSERLVQSLEK